MDEGAMEKEHEAGCACCAGNLSAAELRRIRFLAIAAITAVLAVTAAIAFHVMRG